MTAFALASFALFIGLDVGNSEHHATALTRDGNRAYDAALPSDENNAARPADPADGRSPNDRDRRHSSSSPLVASWLTTCIHPAYCYFGHSKSVVQNTWRGRCYDDLHHAGSISRG